MTDDTELWLKSIAEAPADAHLRLVFADWLQDRDDERAEAVRSSRDAEECLLEFPLEVKRSTKNSKWISHFSPLTPLYPVRRPFLRVENLYRWRIEEFRVSVTVGAVVELWILDKDFTNCSYWFGHNRRRVALGDQSGMQYLLWEGPVHSAGMTLCLKADRPTEAKVGLTMVNQWR